jgi:NADH-quinone oxidoreductase subunit M
VSNLHFPWLELGVLIPLLGAIWVRGIRQPERLRFHSMVFAGLAFGFGLLAWQDSFLFGAISTQNPFWSGLHCFVLDELNAPLLPMVGLMYLLIVSSTLRSKSKQVSFVRLLSSEAIHLALFSCKEPWSVIFLLAMSTVPMYFELRANHKSTRVFSIHMGAQVALFIVGWLLVTTTESVPGVQTVGMALLLIGLLIRCGVAPFHCWVTDLFENANLGHAALIVIPMSGAYAGLRLFHPTAPAWCLQSMEILAVLTVVYSSGMSLIQRDVRRFFAYLVISFSSLVVVGMGLLTTESLAGGMCIWLSSAVTLIGLALTIRALEFRIGRLSLTDHHGLYEHTPTLATFFLITGLGSVGFPGTVGFITLELLVDGVVEVQPVIGGFVVLAMALNGISVLRVYFLLFGGRPHVASISIRCRLSEMIAVAICVSLIFGIGLFPQSFLESRLLSSKELIRDRMVYQKTGEQTSAGDHDVSDD